MTDASPAAAHRATPTDLADHNASALRTLEAEINGSPMVFPLGPDPSLSWATCTVRTGAEEEKTTVYRCELKPGYRF